MKDSAIYLDSSALIKLVFEEAESAALRAFLADHPLRASSVLARVEVLRTVGRVEDPARKDLPARRPGLEGVLPLSCGAHNSVHAIAAPVSLL